MLSEHTTHCGRWPFVLTAGISNQHGQQSSSAELATFSGGWTSTYGQCSTAYEDRDSQLSWPG